MSSLQQSESKIRDVLRTYNIDYRDTNEGFAIKECPECHPDTKDPTNQYKNCFNDAKRVYHCHRCEATGSEEKLISKLTANKVSTGVLISLPKTHDAEILALQKQFEESLPLSDAGSALARTYFDNRGLLVPDSSEIRFNSAVRYYDNEGMYRGDVPAIITRMRNQNSEHTCNHYIYLDQSGNKTAFHPPKKLRGKAKNAVMALVGLPDAGYAVVEGLETGLAVHQATSMTIFVCFSASGVNDFICPSEIKELHIFADQDVSRTGERVAKALANRITASKRKAYLLLPKKSLLGDRKSVDFLDLLNMGIDIKDIVANKQVFTAASHDWPTPLAQEAKNGVIGRFLRLVMPSTEADPNALLIQFLVFFGNFLGRTVKVVNGSMEQYPNLFTVVVGATGTGRKGTGLTEIKRISRVSMPEYHRNCFKSGATSGEGLVHHVRDEVTATKKDPETGEEREEVVDSGVADKRIIFCEPEFQQVLTAGSRAGNNLSSMMRSAWDGEPLETASKNKPCRSLEHSISLIGQITKEELRSSFSATDMANGFANRILWVMSRRSKMIANPKPIDRDELGQIGMELVRRKDFAKSVEEIHFSEDARIVWEHMYAELDRQLSESTYGKVISRNASQIYRISLIYAVLDESKEILPNHLSAARAVWEYCLDSAFYVFGDMEGSPVQRKILAALSDAPNGLTKSQIMDIFGRHKLANNVDEELEELRRRGILESVVEPTGGRNATRWFLL